MVSVCVFVGISQNRNLLSHHVSFSIDVTRKKIENLVRGTIVFFLRGYHRFWRNSNSKLKVKKPGTRVIQFPMREGGKSNVSCGETEVPL